MTGGKQSLRAYPGWVLLQRSQVALQSQAAAVIEQSFHSGHVCLYQLLSLTGCFLLQSLHFFLKTLRAHTRQHARTHTVGERTSCTTPMRVCACLTWMTIFLSARGRFLASLSASSHSLITCEQKESLQMHFRIPRHRGETKRGQAIATGMMQSNKQKKIKNKVALQTVAPLQTTWLSCTV